MATSPVCRAGGIRNVEVWTQNAVSKYFSLMLLLLVFRSHPCHQSLSRNFVLVSLRGPAAGPPRAPPVPGQTEVSPNSPFLSVGAPVVLERVSPGCLLHAGRGAGGTDSFRSPRGATWAGDTAGPAVSGCEPRAGHWARGAPCPLLLFPHTQLSPVAPTWGSRPQHPLHTCIISPAPAIPTFVRSSLQD